MPFPQRPLTATEFIATGFSPAEQGRSLGDWILRWLPLIAIITSLLVAGIGYGSFTLGRLKELRDAKVSSRTQFNAALETARKISDSIQLHPLVCGPYNASGIQRLPASDRERRQLVSHAVLCLRLAKDGTEVASTNELLEIAEYLYASGALGHARSAIEQCKDLGTISDEVDRCTILALVDASDKEGVAAIDHLNHGEGLLVQTKTLGSGERAILQMRLLLARAEVESIDHMDATTETRSRIAECAKQIPNTVPGAATKALAWRFLEPIDAVAPEPPATVSTPSAEEIGLKAAGQLLRMLLKAANRLEQDAPTSSVLTAKHAMPDEGKSASPTGVEVRAWRNETDLILVDEKGQRTPGSLHWNRK